MISPNNAESDSNSHWYHLSVLTTTKDEQQAYLRRLLDGQDHEQQGRTLLSLTESGLHQIEIGFGEKENALSAVKAIWEISQEYDYDIEEALKLDDRVMAYQNIIAQHAEQSKQRQELAKTEKLRYLDTIQKCTGWETFPQGWYQQIPGRDSLQEWSYIATRLSQGEARHRIADFQTSIEPVGTKKPRQRIGPTVLQAFNRKLDVEFGQRRAAAGPRKRKGGPSVEDSHRDDAVGRGTSIPRQETPEHSDQTGLTTPPNTRSPKRTKTTTSDELHALHPQGSGNRHTPLQMEDKRQQLSRSESILQRENTLRREYTLQTAFAEYKRTRGLDDFMAALFEDQLSKHMVERGSAQGGGEAVRETRGRGVIEETPGVGAGADDNGDDDTGATGTSAPATALPPPSPSSETQKMAVMVRFWRALQPLV